MQKYNLVKSGLSLNKLQKVIQQNSLRRIQRSTSRQKMLGQQMSFNVYHRQRLDERAYQKLRKTSNQLSELNITLPFFINDHSVLNKPCKCPFHNRYQKNTKFWGSIKSKHFERHIVENDKKQYRIKTEGNKEHMPNLLSNSTLSKNNNRNSQNFQIKQWNHQKQVSNLQENLDEKKLQNKNDFRMSKLQKQKKLRNPQQMAFKQTIQQGKTQQKQTTSSFKQTKAIRNVFQLKKQKYLAQKLKKKHKKKIKERIKPKQPLIELNSNLKQALNGQPSLTADDIQTVDKWFNQITDEAYLMQPDQNITNRRNCILQNVIKSKMSMFEYFMCKLRQKRLSLVQILNSDHTTYNQSKIVTLKIQNIDGIHSEICQKSKLLKSTLKQFINANYTNNQTKDILNKAVSSIKSILPFLSQEFANIINQHSQFSQKKIQQVCINHQKMYQDIQQKVNFLQEIFTLQDKVQQQRLLRLSLARRMPIMSNLQQKQNGAKWESKSDIGSQSASLKRSNGVRLMDKHKAVTIIKKELSKRDSLFRQRIDSQQQQFHSPKKDLTQSRSYGYLQPFPMKKRRLLKSLTSGINREEIKQKIDDATDFLLSHVKTPNSNKLKRNKQEKSSSEQSQISSNQIKSNISIDFSDDQRKNRKSIKYYICKRLNQTKLCRRVSKHLGQRDLKNLIVKPEDSFLKIKKKLRNIHCWANKKYKQQSQQKQQQKYNNTKRDYKTSRTKNQDSYRRLMDYVQLFQKYCYLGVMGYQKMFQFIKQQKLKKQKIHTQKKVIFAKQSSLQQEMLELKNYLNSKDRQLKFLEIEDKQNQNQGNQRQHNFKIYSYQTYRRIFNQNIRAKYIKKEQPVLSQISMEKQYVIQPPCDYKPENHLKNSYQGNKENNVIDNQKIRLKLPNRNQKFSKTEIRQIFRHALGIKPNFMSTFISQNRSINYSDILLTERFPMLLKSKQKIKQNQSIVKTNFNDSSIIQRSSNDFLKNIQNWDTSLLKNAADKKRKMSTK